MLLESVWVLFHGDSADSVKGHVFAQAWIKSESVVTCGHLNLYAKCVTAETIVV